VSLQLLNNVQLPRSTAGIKPKQQLTCDDAQIVAYKQPTSAWKICFVLEISVLPQRLLWSSASGTIQHRFFTSKPLILENACWRMPSRPEVPKISIPLCLWVNATSIRQGVCQSIQAQWQPTDECVKPAEVITAKVHSAGHRQSGQAGEQNDR